MGFEIGKTVAGYEIVEVLGTSKTGVAYKVRNVFAQRFEVLKILPKSIQDDEEQNARFLREIKVHAQLLHPNIVTFYNARDIEGQLVMTKEFVPGVELADKLKSGPLDWRDASKYAADALAALEYAHARGIVHRGFSSSNLIITEDGLARLNGFGFAKSVSDPELTAAGVVIGALKYMAPEQIKGETIDTRCDIYALGVVLFEMLTGKVPFDAKGQFEIMMAQVSAAPKHVSDVNPAVPRELGDLVAKALAKSPDDRFQSAHECHDAISRFIASQKTAAVEPNTASLPAAEAPKVASEPEALLSPVEPLKDAWALESALELAESKLANLELTSARPVESASSIEAPATSKAETEPVTKPDETAQPEESRAPWRMPVDWSSVNALMASFDTKPREAAVEAPALITTGGSAELVPVAESTTNGFKSHFEAPAEPSPSELRFDRVEPIFETTVAAEVPLFASSTTLTTPEAVSSADTPVESNAPAAVSTLVQPEVSVVEMSAASDISPSAVALTAVEEYPETASASPSPVLKTSVSELVSEKTTSADTPELPAVPQTPVDWLALTAQLAAVDAQLPQAPVAEPKKPVDWLALSAQLAALDAQSSQAPVTEPAAPPVADPTPVTLPNTPADLWTTQWLPPVESKPEPTQLELLSAALDYPKPVTEEQVATEHPEHIEHSPQQDLWAAEPLPSSFDSHSTPADLAYSSLLSEPRHFDNVHEEPAEQPLSLWTSGPPDTWASEPASAPVAKSEAPALEPPPLAYEPPQPVIEFPGSVEASAAQPDPAPESQAIESAAVAAVPTAEPAQEAATVPPPVPVTPVAAKVAQSQPDLLSALFGDTLLSRVSLAIVICAITFFLGTVTLFAVFSVSKP